MDIKTNFGTCLKEILLARGWTASYLAKEINIDSSYVRKWVRGERVPPLKSNYIQKIASSICLNIDSASNNIIKESLLTVLKSICKSIDEKTNLYQSIEEILISSQLYTLSLKSKATKITDISNEKKIRDFIENNESLETIYTENQVYKNLIIPSINDIPQYIEGSQIIVKYALSIIKAAADSELIKSDEIFITYQSKSNYFEDCEEYTPIWNTTLKQAMLKGWKVHYLYRIDKNISRSLNLVSQTIEYAGFNDNFLPSIFNKYGIISPATEIIIVKGIGALFCFAANNNNFVDRAFFYRQKDAVNSLCSHVRKMYDNTYPLLKILPTESDYFKFITLKDRYPGDFFGIFYEVQTCTMPLCIWERYLNRCLDTDEIRWHLNKIRERIELFFRDIKFNKVRHIYNISTFEALFKTAKYISNSKYFVPTPIDIIEHIEYIIHLLKTYNNFEIGMLSQNQNNNIIGAPWEVKGGQAVSIISFNAKVQNETVYLGITDETIAAAFHEYFLEIWDQITPKYRDKNYIISWFEEQLRIFKSTMSKR